MKSKIERLGKVSITVEKDYWDKNKTYNRLTIVERQGTRTAYLSRKVVPIGVEITDRNYWITISKWADIPYEIVQEFGDSPELVISQKVVTLKVNELQEFINSINEIIGEGGSIDERISIAKSDVKSELINGASEEGDTLKKLEDRLSDVEESVGEGGSVDERIAEEGAKHYTKEETYNKTELNSLITTPNQKYVSVSATSQTTDITDVLPATGAADTTYRVGNWDGTQFDASVYSEFAWNGRDYVHLSTKTQIGEVFDISAYHATGGTLATYDDLKDALDTNGKNIPQSLRKGGMSVKFVQSSDNKYVQYRLMSDSFNTTVANWQGVDDEPTAGSDNLVKSGGVEEYITENKSLITLTGLGSQISIIYFNCIKGHKYRIYLNNINPDNSEITYTSNYYDYFVIKEVDNSHATINVLYRRGCDTKENELNYYYDIQIGTGEILAIGGRFSTNEKLKFSVQDITDIQIEVPNKIAWDTSDIKRNTIRQYSDTRLAIYFENGSILNKKYTSSLDTFVGYGTVNVIKLPVDADSIRYIRIKVAYSEYTLTCALVDDSDNIVSACGRNATGASLYQYMIVPSTAKYLVYGISSSIIPSIEFYTTSNIEDVDLTISSGTNTDIDPAFVLRAYYDSSYIGRNLFEVISFNKSPQTYIIPINGYSLVSFGLLRSSSNYGAAVCDKDGNIIDIITQPVGLDYNFTYRIPNEAWYIVAPMLTSFLPFTIHLRTKGLESLEEDGISFVSGDINGNTGEIIDSIKNDRVVSNAVSLSSGFYLRVNEEYRIISAYVYNLDNELVMNNYLPNNSPQDNSLGYYSYPYQYFDYKMFSTYHILPQYKIRFVIGKQDTGTIESDECIVNRFEKINTNLCKRKIPTDINSYVKMKKRLYSLFNCCWQSLENILPATPLSTSSQNFDKVFFKKGNSRTGIPYSEASEYSKYIGQDVSVFTFLTSLLNRRSVMYTEKINKSASGFSNGNESKYGLEYHGLTQQYASSYYGTVCTGLTGYVAGLKNLFISGDYHSIPSKIGLTLVENPSSSNVEVMDFIWNTGHCSVISDIILDEFNQVKYICWAEQTKPTPYITLYTPQEFEQRLSRASCEVYRYNNWTSLEDINDFDDSLVQTFEGDFPKKVSIDKDISTFAGEYCVFTTMPDTDVENNNKAFLTIHRGNKYTTLQIFSEEDTLLTSPILESSILDENSWILQSNIYPEDEKSLEDWIIVDLKKLPNLLPAGKYKARVTDGSSLMSGFSHFEMVFISFTASIENGMTICTFSNSSNCVPTLIRRERQDGIYYPGETGIEANGYHIIDSESSPISIQWTDYSTYNYIKLYVKSDYGTSVHRIKMI